MEYAVAGGLVLAIILSVVGAAFWAFRKGRLAERGDSAVASNEVRDKQLQTAADAPKNKDALIDRIRKEGW